MHRGLGGVSAKVAIGVNNTQTQVKMNPGSPSPAYFSIVVSR